METNESLIATLRSRLKELLRIINGKTHLWHYGILLPETSRSSLSSLLRLTQNELINILKVCGLLKENKVGALSLQITQSVKHGTFSWLELLNDAQLNKNYLDQMKVSNINDCDTITNKYGG